MKMDAEKLKRMSEETGIIVAMDQNAARTPETLRRYGITQDSYHNEKEMLDLIHEVRLRIIKNPSFDRKKVLAVILFRDTANRLIDGSYTANYLWDRKRILSFMKVDGGLEGQTGYVRLLKEIPGLRETMKDAKKEYGIFGTKARSLITGYDEKGIGDVLKQQFEIAYMAWEEGLVPIIEPETDIAAEDKRRCEELLLELLLRELAVIPDAMRVVFKLTLPVIPDHYQRLIDDPHVLKVAALSGGYSQEEAVSYLAENHGMIASFSRAFSENLRYDVSETEWEQTLSNTIDSIYQASVT